MKTSVHPTVEEKEPAVNVPVLLLAAHDWIL